MSSCEKSDKETNTARDPSLSEESVTARDPTLSEESTTARDPTPSEGSNTAKEISEKDITAKEPGTDTDQENRVRVQEELEGPVKETYLQHHNPYGYEEFDMTSVMFNRKNPAPTMDPATAEAENARKKKLAAAKKR